MRHLPLLLLLSTGCAYITDADEEWRLDPDGDGVPLGKDCDDEDSSLGTSVTWYTDADGDGYGDPDTQASGCQAPEDASANGQDCDDSSADVYPGADDQWYDGVDSDCAGDDDYDQDGDGYGVEQDCDDTDPELFPDESLAEIYYNGVDDDCDVETTPDGDKDGDGFWAADYASKVNANDGIPLDIPAGAQGDCWDDPDQPPADVEPINDFSPLNAVDLHPDADERYYDGVDQDCLGADTNDDGISDDFDWDLDGDASQLWPDRDDNLGGDCLDCACTGGDCPDSCIGEIDNPAELPAEDVNSSADEEFYDGTDQDCLGDGDFDQDGDGYDHDDYGGSDCDDLNPTVHPGAVDSWYDGEDSDCSGGSDNDADGDGHDWDGAGGDDCDDTDSSINPSATEIWYDGVDQDCAQDDDYDADGDGYQHEDYVSGTTEGDCHDDYAAANPGVNTEIEGNGYDDDCSGDSNGNMLDEVLAASDADALWLGSTSGDGAGRTVSPAGDVDGDGIDDLLISIPDDDAGGTDAGAVVLLPGSQATDGGDLEDTDGALLLGDSDGDVLGYGLAAMGDLDGDGYDDFAVGAYTEDVDYSNDGATYVVFGPPTSDNISAVASGWYAGTTGNSNVGRVLANAGDHDGDGFADLLVGAPYDDSGATSNSGLVWLVDGPLTSLSYVSEYPVISSEDDDGENLGLGLTGDHDFDGDGQADIAIGAPYLDTSAFIYAGAAYVLHGPVTGDLDLSTTSADRRYTGSADYAYAGYDLSGGDLNNDGYDDLVIGAPYGSSYQGQAVVITGPLTASTDLDSAATGIVHGDDTYSFFGGSVSAGGDLDGDGNDDLAVGAHRADHSASNDGEAWFFYGPLSGTSAASDLLSGTVYGDQSSDLLGEDVAIVGDIDQDGYDDVLTGAYLYDRNSFTSGSGAAYLLLGGAL